MPPGGRGGGGGGGGGEHGYGEPATAHGGGQDEEDSSRSSPPPPLPLLPGLVAIPPAAEEQKKKRKHVQQQQEEEPTATASFGEDVLIEILSRVPYRSLCRFKCVSNEWLALCSDSGVRKRSPQSMSGFFYYDRGWCFQNLSGKGPPMVDPDLPFLRSTYKHFTVRQCSTSLLLCQCWKSCHPEQYGWNSLPTPEMWRCLEWPEAKEFDYVVCNPATQEWTVLPPIELPDHLSRSFPGNYFVGFDPAFPSRFVVFVPLHTRYDLPTIMIYLSETGGWTSMQNQHDDFTTSSFILDMGITFLNGIMHFPTRSLSMVTVDMKRNAWRKFKMPPGMINNCWNVSIGQSQGRLCVWQKKRQDYKLSIWVLENYDSGQWTLKYTVNCLELFGQGWWMFAIHPERNLIFLTDSEEKILSYDMDNQKVHVIRASGKLFEPLPYTPCFAE